nr:unnamed protein product [Digitaria exilis]
MDLPYQAVLVVIDRLQEPAAAASDAAVAGLEKQTFHTGGGSGGVSVMPCFHDHGFHSDCITKWLGRSNMCPLCRHQLPTDVTDVDGK